MMVAALSNTAAPAWDRNAQADTAAGLEAHPAGMAFQSLPDSRTPNTPGPARVGFAGLRQSLERVVGTWIIPLPKLPARVIAARPVPVGAGGPATVPIRPGVVSSALVGVEQTAPWYEHINLK